MSVSHSSHNQINYTQVTHINVISSLQSDSECLQNQLCIIYKCARMCPLQSAFQLENCDFDPMLHCSVVLVRILSKLILTVLIKYIEVNNVGNLSLQADEALFVASTLNDLLLSDPRTSSSDLIFFSIEDILQLLQHLTLLSSDKTFCKLPLLLDALLCLCSQHNDSFTVELALNCLWNLSHDPAVALAILNHENAISTLQNMWVISTRTLDLSHNILWMLGYGNAQCEL